MATPDEVQAIIALLHKNRPNLKFQEFHRTESGLFAVLHYLQHHEGGVKSKDISDALGISSARTAILLKKMEQKQLITKSDSPTDARITIVTLSEKGGAFTQTMQTHMRQCAAELCDTFGVAQLESIFATITQLETIMQKNLLGVMEDYND